MQFKIHIWKTYPSKSSPEHIYIEVLDQNTNIHEYVFKHNNISLVISFISFPQFAVTAYGTDNRSRVINEKLYNSYGSRIHRDCPFSIFDKRKLSINIITNKNCRNSNGFYIPRKLAKQVIEIIRESSKDFPYIQSERVKEQQPGLIIL